MALEDIKAFLLTHTTTTLLTSTLAGFLGLVVIRALTKKKLRLPPGPKGWPVIGQVGLLSRDDLEEDLKRLTAEYGDIIYIPLPFAPVVALTSYKVIKEAFVKKGQHFSHRPRMMAMTLMDFYDEIAAPSVSDKWKRDKAFAISSLKQFTSKRFGGEDIIFREFDQLNEDIKASTGQTYDCIPIVQRTTANVIHGVVFGERFAYSDPQLDCFMKIVSEWYIAVSSFTQVVTSMPDFLAKRIYKEDSKALYDTNYNLEIYVRDKVTKHRETYDPDNVRDIIDRYLKRKDDLSEKEWKEVYHTIIALLPDAVDSIAAVINFAVLYAGSYPEIQKEVQNEIEGMSSSTPYVTLQHKTELPKTEAFCLEVMRITSVLSETLVHCCHDDTELCGYDIPKDIEIMASLYLAMHDPAVYPDPYTFNPHRFLGEDGSVKKDTLLSFGIGKRICPGEELSKLEIFIMVANILKRYRITFPEDQPNPDLEPIPLFIRVPKPFKCIFTPVC